MSDRVRDLSYHEALFGWSGCLNTDAADVSHSAFKLFNTYEMLFYMLWLCFRIGLVFVVSDEDDIDGMQDAGVPWCVPTTTSKMKWIVRARSKLSSR